MTSSHTSQRIQKHWTELLLDVLSCSHLVIIPLAPTEDKLHKDRNFVSFITGSPEPRTAAHIAGVNLKRFNE